MGNKTYTLENFKVNDYAWKIIDAEGRWTKYDGGKFDINYSSILTKLIQEAGRYCESHASDLFIDWATIDAHLRKADFTGGVFLFGFRKLGVDGNTYILSRYNNDGRYAEYEYRSLWRLDIEREDDEITMKLGRVF